MHMSWQNLLFAHWPIAPLVMRERIADACGGWPPDLELDTFEGRAWLGVVPFSMARTGLRWWPTVLGPHSFHELNVRTYVRHGDKPGVLFFSLDAASPLAVFTARRWFHLPYFNARMSLSSSDGQFTYAIARTHRGAAPASFCANYRPLGDVFFSVPGTLDAWLTERYCLYAIDRKLRAWRGEIHHGPWPLQGAQASIENNDMGRCHGFKLPDVKPILHFVKNIDVVAWSPERVR